MALPFNPSTLTLYGGKKLAGFPVTDTSTQRSNDQINQCFADAAMMTRSALSGWLRVQMYDDSGDGYIKLSNSTSWNATWKGSTSTSPVFGVVSEGVYTITFPTSVSDELGGSHDTTLKFAQAFIESGIFGHCQCSVTDNVITLYVATMAGSQTGVASTYGGVNISIVFV